MTAQCRHGWKSDHCPYRYDDTAPMGACGRPDPPPYAFYRCDPTEGPATPTRGDRLVSPRNGWTSRYDPATDTIHSRTPEGQHRTYRRVSDPHVNYPHEPGRLHDCIGCEQGPCTCDGATAPCVSEQCDNYGADTCQGCPTETGPVYPAGRDGHAPDCTECPAHCQCDNRRRAVFAGPDA